jgi:hypothetical protein
VSAGGVLLNNKNLVNLIKAFKGDIPEVHVGILGAGKSRKKGATQSNAEIGARHEYGTSKMPIRSFLRVPLTEQLEGYIERAGGFDEMALKEVFAQKSIKPYVNKIAITAEQVVQDAFNTGGFGAWKPSDMRRKKNKQTLVETQQLRNSVTSEVVE